MTEYGLVYHMHLHYILLPSANIDRIANSEFLIYFCNNSKNVKFKTYSYLNELSSKFHKTGISEAEASLNPSEKEKKHIKTNRSSLITHA